MSKADRLSLSSVASYPCLIHFRIVDNAIPSVREMEQRRSSVAGLTEYPTDSVHEEWQVGDTVQLRTEPFEL